MDIDTEKFESAIAQVDRLPSSDWVRRILGIAIFGRFSICFVGSEEGVAPNWSVITREFDLAAYFLKPCPCGNLLNPRRACVCTLFEIKKFHEEPSVKTARAADLYVEVPNSVTGRRHGGSFRETLERGRGIEFRSLSLSSDAERLLRIAVKNYPLSKSGREKTRQIATAIACLGQSPSIEAQHIAEALQYQPRNLS